MSSINQKYVELEIMVGIVSELYGSDLNIKELTVYVNLEFDKDFTEDDINEFYQEHYLIKSYEEKQASDTVRWEDLR